VRSHYRADKDAIDRFRKGYQTRMNAALRVQRSIFRSKDLTLHFEPLWRARGV
jgi:hypothetical protein